MIATHPARAFSSRGFLAVKHLVGAFYVFSRIFGVSGAELRSPEPVFFLKIFGEEGSPAVESFAICLICEAGGGQFLGQEESS